MKWRSALNRRSFIKRTIATALGLMLFPREILPTLEQLRGGWKPRNLKNPIFTGEIGKYDSVRLYQVKEAIETDNGNTSK